MRALMVANELGNLMAVPDKLEGWIEWAECIVSGYTKVTLFIAEK
jgi:hypothetical protein